ncbi:hypothetical protein BDZ85DRAFT_257882 [Elsinoe ampelina]|uniref:ubiquitinyl hydrolase 1 n=1 Tax=Elsinoe ampelina TaxID=302913 RepID=A0A6A6GIX6_9PEZI|nr:hypothetical protein BDZ85DRAFT_257882 [Elsinoe ampelina]
MSSYRVLDGERGFRHIRLDDTTGVRYSLQTWTALGFALIYAFHVLVKHFDLAILSPAELLWNATIHVIPIQLIQLLGRATGMAVDVETRISEAGTRSEMRAIKSDALRQVLRLGSGVPNMPIGLQNLKGQHTASAPAKSDKPPGLGNWDNSCYQNSILQGLSSLPSFARFLNTSTALLSDDATSTTGSLHALTKDLTSLGNNGKRIWTPAKLKSMSSWQQQDAQEYYSRILDDVEKDLKKVLGSKTDHVGLKVVNEIAQGERKQDNVPERVAENPLEGLLGQRVGCTSCGHSEGLTLLPFNCVTVSLGNGHRFSLENLLDEYTNLENIDGVECLSCTFKRQEQRLQALLGSDDAAASESASPAKPSTMLPDAVQKQISERLQAIRQAIEDGEFSDQAVKRCAITKDAKVSSTKTKQVVLARPPKSLTIHVNRSIFDEMTGALRKNMARVDYPKYISLKPWTLGQDRQCEAGSFESWPLTPGQSLVSQHRGSPPKASPDYVLRAVVTHYGRHENGHYVCYRQHRTDSGATAQDDEQQKKADQWWRLSDDDVIQATEDEVLKQGGVFMLFYEHLPASDIPLPEREVTMEIPEAVAEVAASTKDVDAEEDENVQQPDTSVASSGHDSEEIVTVSSNQSEVAQPVLPTGAAHIDVQDGSNNDSNERGQKQQPVTPPPQMLRTSRAKSRKGSAMLTRGLPALTAQ